MTIYINDHEYPVATTLRVAYQVQNQNNSKSYTEVFQNLAAMGIEQQIGIIYTAFRCANASSPMTKEEFVNYYLDHSNVREVLNQVKEIMRGIMGVTDEEMEASSTEQKPVDSQEN